MVGVGFIGQLAHLMNYVEAADCDVVAVAEFRPELRRRVAERYAIPRSYATHRELLNDPDVEAVVVVTPRPFTGLTVLDCLEAGKHVLSEKPMAGTVEQGQRLVAAARARGVHYVVGYMKRYDEGVELAKRALDEAIATGELGKIAYARTHCYMGDSYCNPWGHVITDEKADYIGSGWPVAPDWLSPEWQKPFAAYVNTYSHNTNLLRYLFGRTPRVQHADVSRSNGQIAVLDFGEFSATVETGRTSNRGWDEVTEIFFDDGRITLKTPPALLRNIPATVQIYRAGNKQELVVPQPYWSWSFRRQADAFIKTVRLNISSISSGEDSLEDLRLIETIWKEDIRISG